MTIEVFHYDILYVGVALIITELYWLIDRKETKNIRILDILMICVLVFFSAFRYNVGSDYQSYLERYRYIIQNWNIVQGRIHSEKLFYQLCYLTSCLTKSRFGVFFMCAVVQYPILVAVARKNCLHPSRVIFCYVFLEFYAISNNILRQSLALEFVMLGVLAWINKKRIVSLFLFLVAFGFHTTAILGIILFLASLRLKPNITTYLVCMFASIVFFFGWKYIIQIIAFIPYVNKYTGYFVKNGNHVARAAMYLYFGFYNFLSILFIKNSRRIQEYNKNHYKFISCILLSLPLFAVATHMVYANRIGMYLYQFSIFLVADLFEIINRNVNKIKLEQVFLKSTLIIWLLLVNVLSINNSFWQYSFIWSQ